MAQALTSQDRRHIELIPPQAGLTLVHRGWLARHRGRRARGPPSGVKQMEACSHAVPSAEPLTRLADGTVKISPFTGTEVDRAGRANRPISHLVTEVRPLERPTAPTAAPSARATWKRS